MYSTTIYIPDVIIAKRFVEIIEKYPEIKMSIKSDNLEIDPHSIMGVLSLDLSKTFTLETNDRVPLKLKQELVPFMATSEN